MKARHRRDGTVEFYTKNNFRTGVERPIETTRNKWLIKLGNLETYFDVCLEVFVEAGVVRVNPDYDPNVEGSEPIFIGKPHQIASFDETKVALDSTIISDGKQDRGLRAGVDNDGEWFVINSSSYATVVCGRLGTGETLLPYIIFAVDNTYYLAYAPDFLSDIKNKDGEYMTWRYAISKRKPLLTT
jgi:hypothetical protein